MQPPKETDAWQGLLKRNGKHDKMLSGLVDNGMFTKEWLIRLEGGRYFAEFCESADRLGIHSFGQVLEHLGKKSFMREMDETPSVMCSILYAAYKVPVEQPDVFFPKMLEELSNYFVGTREWFSWAFAVQIGTAKVGKKGRVMCELVEEGVFGKEWVLELELLNNQFILKSFCEAVETLGVERLKTARRLLGDGRFDKMVEEEPFRACMLLVAASRASTQSKEVFLSDLQRELARVPGMEDWFKGRFMDQPKSARVRTEKKAEAAPAAELQRSAAPVLTLTGNERNAVDKMGCEKPNAVPAFRLAEDEKKAMDRLNGEESKERRLLLIDRELAQHPEYLFLRLRKAEIYQDAGNFPKAEMALNELLKASPAFPPALRRRGEVRKRMGRPEEALKDFIAYAEVRPDDGEGWLGAAAIYMEWGQEYRAMDALGKGLVAVNDGGSKEKIRRELGRLRPRRMDVVGQQQNGDKVEFKNLELEPDEMKKEVREMKLLIKINKNCREMLSKDEAIGAILSGNVTRGSNGSYFVKYGELEFYCVPQSVFQNGKLQGAHVFVTRINGKASAPQQETSMPPIVTGMHNNAEREKTVSGLMARIDMEKLGRIARNESHYEYLEYVCRKKSDAFPAEYSGEMTELSMMAYNIAGAIYSELKPKDGDMIEEARQSELLGEKLRPVLWELIKGDVKKAR